MPPPSYDSSTPLISSAERPGLPQFRQHHHQHQGHSDPVPDTPHTDVKYSKTTAKWKLLGLVKRKDDRQAMDAPGTSHARLSGLSSSPLKQLPQLQAPARASASSQEPSPHQQQQQQPLLDLRLAAQPALPSPSPSRTPHQPAFAASSSLLRSSSPRLHSPASSEIFERNVQEPIPISTRGGELSPAHIPTHVITEDSIPPALEASVQAITSGEWNPDEVEIVTSSSHQPASATLEHSASHADLALLNSPAYLSSSLLRQRSDEADSFTGLHHSATILSPEDDSTSNYGQLDPHDVRRLSFISFKDIVQREHQEMAHASLGEVGSRDSYHQMSSLPPALLQDHRATSPLRSPRSPRSPASPQSPRSLASLHSAGPSGGPTPPVVGVGVSPFPANSEQSQSSVRGIGLGRSGSQHGELTIETMTQALRRTASGDLSGVWSPGMSPVGDEHSIRSALQGRTMI